jgi:hypothetical protein
MQTGFFGEMKFSETLIPYDWNTDWIPSKVEEMIEVMNNSSIPEVMKAAKTALMPSKDLYLMPNVYSYPQKAQEHKLKRI